MDLEGRDVAKVERLRGAQLIATKYEMTCEEAEEVSQLALELVFWRVGETSLDPSESSPHLKTFAMGWAVELPNDIGDAEEILQNVVKAIRWTREPQQAQPRSISSAG